MYGLLKHRLAPQNSIQEAQLSHNQDRPTIVVVVVVVAVSG
jgi:hypothetical protein